MNKQFKKLIFLLSTLVIFTGISGCTGFSVQGNSARSGETVSATLGYHPDLTQNNIKIEVTDFAGNLTTYLPNDPAIQLVYNMYPDPISSLLVSGETNLDIDGVPNTLESYLTNLTNNSKDLFQTAAFFDLPLNMASGTAHIQVFKNVTEPLIPTDSAGLSKLQVEIVGGEGESQIWDVTEGGVVAPVLRKSLQRVTNYGVVTFSGSTVPHIIQLTLTHGADIDADPVNGSGRPFITTPRGDTIGVTSHDDGLKMNVILSPIKINEVQTKIENFKFYVAGDITGWQIESGSVKAYDVNGVQVDVTENLVVYSSTP